VKNAAHPKTAYDDDLEKWLKARLRGTYWPDENMFEFHDFILHQVNALLAPNQISSPDEDELDWDGPPGRRANGAVGAGLAMPFLPLLGHQGLSNGAAGAAPGGFAL